jgi:hypothetical protein
MDDGTIHWLISAIIQSMATIWAIIFGLTLGLHEFLDRKKKQFEERHPDKTISTNYGEIKIARYRISTEDKVLLLLMNLTMPLSIFSGIFSMIFFRNDFLIYSAVLFALISIILLMIYITLWIKNINHSDF